MCVCVCAVAMHLVQFAGFVCHIKAASLAMNFATIICANSQRASRITAAIRGCWVEALIHLLSLTTCVFGEALQVHFLSLSPLKSFVIIGEADLVLHSKNKCMYANVMPFICCFILSCWPYIIIINFIAHGGAKISEKWSMQRCRFLVTGGGNSLDEILYYEYDYKWYMQHVCIGIISDLMGLRIISSKIRLTNLTHISLQCPMTNHDKSSSCNWYESRSLHLM